MFADRTDAGRRLASAFRSWVFDGPVTVLGLPRGGVPVAFEVACALGAPLDVLVVRKLAASGHPEYAFGAVVDASHPEVFVDRRITASLGVSDEEIDAVVRRETAELERRDELFRAGRLPLDVRGRTVILVDDGLATGATARVAISWLARAGAKQVILAIPVAPPETLAEFRRHVDDVVCLAQPLDFVAVGQFYTDFSQTSDNEVLSLLARASGMPSR